MSGLGRALRVVVPPLVLLACVLLVWHVAAWHVNAAYLLPSPMLVATTAWERRIALGKAAGMTASAALAGICLSLLLGTVVALVFSQSAWIRRAGYPYAIFLQTVPIVGVAPLIITWCGAGFQSVVIVAMVISIFPVINNTTLGLTSIEPGLADLFAVYNASRWQTLWKLRFPSAVPYWVAGAKISCGLSVVGAIVGEIFAGYGADTSGLGYLIMLTRSNLDAAYLFAAVLASTLLGLAVFGAVNLAGNMLLARWYVASSGRSTLNK